MFYKIRDVEIITNKRIIIADKQGLTGKKVEIYTIPLKSVNYPILIEFYQLHECLYLHLSLGLFQREVL
ncbi:MAG: PH domain-containing protein [Cetobacterium sp.]